MYAYFCVGGEREHISKNNYNYLR